MESDFCRWARFLVSVSFQQKDRYSNVIAPVSFIHNEWIYSWTELLSLVLDQVGECVGRDPPTRPDIVDGIGDHVSYFSFSTLDRLLSKCSLRFLEHLFNFLSVRYSRSLAQFFYGKNLVNQLNHVVAQFCSSNFNTTSVIAHVNSFYFLKEIICIVTVFWPPHSKMSRETRFSCGISLSSTTSDSHSPLQPHIQPRKMIQKR